MRTLVILAALLLSLATGVSCDSKKSNVRQIDKNDPRVAAAKAEAQRRWPEFEAAFKARDPKRAYAVKSPFPTKDGSSEHMWVQVRSIDGEKITGELDNDPVDDVGLKAGDSVTLKLADVEDWIVAEGAILAGGFSIPEEMKGK